MRAVPNLDSAPLFPLKSESLDHPVARSFYDSKAVVMSRRFVHQMQDGDTIEEVYLATDKQLRANRNGNLYLQLELRDRTGSISARLWNASEGVVRAFEAGDFLLVKGKVQLFQGALQMILSQIDRV